MTRIGSARSIHVGQCMNQEIGTVEARGKGISLEGKRYECIHAEAVEGGAVGLVTLDRPKALNALSEALMMEVVDALQTFDAETQVCSISLPKLILCSLVTPSPHWLSRPLRHAASSLCIFLLLVIIFIISFVNCFSQLPVAML